VEFLPSKRSGHSDFRNCFPVIPKLISAGALYSVMPLDQGFPQNKQPLGSPLGACLFWELFGAGHYTKLLSTSAILTLHSLVYVLSLLGMIISCNDIGSEWNLHLSAHHSEMNGVRTGKHVFIVHLTRVLSYVLTHPHPSTFLVATKWLAYYLPTYLPTQVPTSITYLFRCDASYSLTWVVSYLGRGMGK